MPGPPGELDLEALRGRADEISLVVQHHRNVRRNELAAEESHAQLRLSRAILCGVSADFILPQIARAARHYVQAEFIAWGGEAAPPIAGEAWDGPAGCLAALRQERLVQLWRKVFEQGRESEIPAEGLANFSAHRRNSPIPFWIGWWPSPLKWDQDARRPDGRSFTFGKFQEDFPKLESYALLVASALDREAAREEQTASSEVLRKIIEDSEECLIVIDKEGKILESSRAAALLLFRALGPRWKGRCLRNYFPQSRATRSSNGESGSSRRLRRRLLPRPLVRRPLLPCPRRIKKKFARVALEAALVRGDIIRMQVRREISGMGWSGPRWLLHLEDQGARRTPRQSEERTETELAAPRGLHRIRGAVARCRRTDSHCQRPVGGHLWILNRAACWSSGRLAR